MRRHEARGVHEQGEGICAHHEHRDHQVTAGRHARRHRIEARIGRFG